MAQGSWQELPAGVDFRLGVARAQPTLDKNPFHSWELSNSEPWAQFYRINGSYLLRFPDLADFQVSTDGHNVTCIPVPGVSEDTVQHLYLNQVLPLALSKLGQLVFHASAVEVAGGAVAFIGESGRGKSTLAASFATSGFRFLTDDGLVVKSGSQGVEVLPNQASIRLWEDSEEAIIPSKVKTAPPVDYTSKVRFLADEALVYCKQPRLLRKAYFLGDGSAHGVEIRRLSAADALVAWVKHSFLLDLEEKSMLASHFDQVAKLANLPIHYRLDYPRRFEDLARVRQAIVEHAHDTGQAHHNAQHA